VCVRVCVRVSGVDSVMLGLLSDSGVVSDCKPVLWVSRLPLAVRLVYRVPVGTLTPHYRLCVRVCVTFLYLYLMDRCVCLMSKRV